MAAYYDEFENKYYNPDDNDKKPGDNENWKMIQKGFSKISSTQLETSEGLTLGKGTDDEESLTASELEELKNPSQLETSGGLTLGKGTEDEESLTAEELTEIKNSILPKVKEFGGTLSSVLSTSSTVAANKVGDVRLRIQLTDLNPNSHYSFIAVTASGGQDGMFVLGALPVSLNIPTDATGKAIINADVILVNMTNNDINVTSNTLNGTYNGLIMEYEPVD